MHRGIRAVLTFCAIVVFLSSKAESTSSPVNTRAAAETERILAATTDSPSGYRIIAVQIGRTRTAPRGLFINDPSLPHRIEISFSFWVLVGEGRVILIDTGFVNRDMISRWHIDGYRSPQEALREVGFAPQEVTDVILTHSHWDHIGGLSLYKKAVLHVSATAYRNHRRAHDAPFSALFRLADRQGRIQIARGPKSVAPGITAVPVGLHTPDFQYVVVKNPDGIWVAAGDIAPLYANFRNRKPTGQTVSAEKTLFVQETMLQLVKGDLGHIIPGHEPGIYPSADTKSVQLSPVLRDRSKGPAPGNPKDSASFGK